MKTSVLLGLGALLTFASAGPVQGGGGDAGTARRAALSVTTNYAPLRRVAVPEGTSSASQLGRRRVSLGAADVAPPKKGLVGMRNVKDVYYTADLTIGNNRVIPVQIDTASSDTWFIIEDFVCAASIRPPGPKCGFGRGLAGNLSQMVPEDFFLRQYQDTTFVAGFYGFDDVTVGGITAPHQQLALVNYTYWFGDGLSSGLLGLAYPLMTSLDGPDKIREPYDPIFTNMWKRNLIDPIFSLSVSRGSSNASAGEDDGNYLAFGGLPPVKIDESSWATTKLQVMDVLDVWPHKTQEFGFYIITADAWVYAPGNETAPTADKGGIRVTTPSPIVVDIGSTLTRLPAVITQPLYKLFDPPATYEDWYSIWIVNCTAKAPHFGMQIGDKIFYVNAADLIEQNATDDAGVMCRIGFQEVEDGPHTLGLSFLNNVVAVFDAGNTEMRFAAKAKK